MEKIYGMHKLVGLQLFWSRTPTFSSGTPTFCQMGVLNSCFQNPSESSGMCIIFSLGQVRGSILVTAFPVSNSHQGPPNMKITFYRYCDFCISRKITFNNGKIVVCGRLQQS